MFPGEPINLSLLPSPAKTIASAVRAGDNLLSDAYNAGAARERAGWVGAIGVCQAFAALRGAK